MNKMNQIKILFSKNGLTIFLSTTATLLIFGSIFVFISKINPPTPLPQPIPNTLSLIGRSPNPSPIHKPIAQITKISKTNPSSTLTPKPLPTLSPTPTASPSATPEPTVTPTPIPF